ncbi:uncharacterized protein LOC133168988 isoform X1 [Syngnathus typhle]|uniref:uncharacterized protein LOC133168988 isoform X1 n=2 Tax=Syngnathus typhle TaxID=161592 RepID=UPI002A6A190D|nr:uncharacterized protein LOC133168988 isoform X1 [Syngnathus typhle]
MLVEDRGTGTGAEAPVAPETKVTNAKRGMVVLSTDDEWSSLVSLLRESTVDKELTSQGSKQFCFELVLDNRVVSLHRADLLQDATDEVVGQAVNGHFESCADGIAAFLLLIRGGLYTAGQMRLVKLLQIHFGAEAIKYLVVVSLEDGKTVDMLDDALLELINACDGRYCRLTASATREKVGALVSMVNYSLAENSGGGGYSRAMLYEDKRRSTEDMAIELLRQKAREAGEKAKVCGQMSVQREERRAKEVEELRAKHAEERRQEATERRCYEAKKESLEEAVISHQATFQLYNKPDDDDPSKLSVVLLGLSGSGKTSALNVISAQAGNRYPDSGYGRETTKPTLSCARREIRGPGRRLVLVDTPELWDEDGVENLEMVKDCVALALPGPHIYLLVLQVGRFTQCESLMLAHLHKVFGRNASEHAMVLFVHMDQQQPKRSQRVHHYVAGAHAALRELLRRCGSRYYELSLAAPHDALSYPQVRELMMGIDKLAAAHGGRGHVIKRFSTQELQDRKKVMAGTEGAAWEDKFLLIED